MKSMKWSCTDAAEQRKPPSIPGLCEAQRCFASQTPSNAMCLCQFTQQESSYSFLIHDQTHMLCQDNSLQCPFLKNVYSEEMPCVCSLFLPLAWINSCLSTQKRNKNRKHLHIQETKRKFSIQQMLINEIY